jgi:hypothetical protein
METRLLMAADLSPPLLEQPAGEIMLPDGDLFLPGSIAGRVFATSADDGVYQPGDDGIAGVRVELLASDGRLLAEVFTDALGRYDFPALEPGVYAIRETQPNGFDDGPDWLGVDGGWVEANDLLSQIVVLPGMDLNGYDFAERLTAALPEEETPPTEPGTEPIPNPTPMPIDEPVQTPLAGFVPLPTVEWRRSVNAVQEETIAEPVESSSLRVAPLTQRPAERIFGSGGQPIDKQALDFDAVLTQGYELLAEFFWDFGEASEVVAGAGEATPAAEQDEAMTAEETRNAARERAFEADEPQPIADVPTPAPQPATSPGRRVDDSHQLAGKPAA